MTATRASVPGLYVGTSGWSYPSWRPGFYPAGSEARGVPRPLCGAPAERRAQLDGLPDSGRGSVPALGRADTVRPSASPSRCRPTSSGRPRRSRSACALLGERLGPIRLLVTQARDEGFLTLALGSLDPELRIAFDFRHDSWEGVELPENAVRVNEREAPAPFRYLRFREPPYSEKDLARIAGEIGPLLAEGLEVYAYFRHEDEPSAPQYAERLLELLA